LLNIFTLAFAQTKALGIGGKAGASSWMGMVPFVLMIVIFYFLLIRPQQKKEKERKLMISKVQKGDKILTTGGIYGTISSIKDENTIVLKIADGTKVELARSAITGKVS